MATRSILQVLAVALSTLGVSVQAAPVQTWVASSMANIFKDTTAPAHPSTAIVLLAARNEAESAQICVRPSKAFTISSVTFFDLMMGTNLIPATAISCHFVEYVHFDANSVDLSGTVRNGAADYPDPLSNERSIGVEANVTQPIWMTVKVPKGQAAGVYRGSAIIDSTAGKVVIPISLEVVNAEIPDAKNGFLNALRWDVGYGTRSGLCTLYGAKPYSPKWWELWGKICDNAVANRTNVANIVPMQLMMDGGSYKITPTQFVFNWTRFDETVRFLLAKGFRRIDAGGLASRDYANPKMPVTVDIIGGDKAKPSWDRAAPGSDEAKRYLQQYLPALENHLLEKGWLGVFATQILDEPRDQPNANWDTIASDVPPEIRLVETIFKISGKTATAFQTHAGTIDTWIPSIQLYEEPAAKKALDRRQKAGDEKWFYTYGEDSRHWLSRLIDAPVYNNRLIFWYAFAHDMDGYLHGGYNTWTGGTIDQDEQKLHGDSHLIYPDVAHNTIKSSIRESNQRDGVEDLELFRLLNKRDPALARKIVGEIVTSGTVYSHDIDKIAATRERLLRAVAPPPPAVTPGH